MERSVKVKCLAKVAAVDSLDRNLQTEDAEAKRYGEQFENVDKCCGSRDTEDDPMRILSAGNVVVHQHEPPKASIPPMTSKLAKLALGGALLASGVGLGAGIPLMMKVFDRAEVAPAPTAAGGYEYLGRVFDPSGE